MSEYFIAIAGMVGAVITALITGFVTYRVGAGNARAAEKLASSEVQIAVNDAFKLLIATLSSDREKMRDEIAEMKVEIQTMGMDIVLLTTHVARLEDELVKTGAIVPPRPSRRGTVKQ